MKRIVCWFFLGAAAVASGGVASRYWPSWTNDLEVVCHQDYTLGYCEDWEIPAWVAEVLKPSMFVANYERSSGFRSDKAVSTGSAATTDYTNSGYDRGHMAPAADFAYDETAMYESFYMSNMAPQEPNLNRGVWAALEDWTRTVATRERKLLVVTGPVVTGEVARIGKNKVAVPHGFYKALCDLTAPRKMIGFLYANKQGESKEIAAHAVSIDTIEELTGLDLFATFKSDAQEAVCDFAAWTNRTEKAAGFIIVCQ